MPENNEVAGWLSLRLFMTALLGVPLLFSLAMYIERRWGRSSRSSLACLVGFLPMGVYFFTLPDSVDHVSNALWIRFFALLAGFHFLAAFAPFLGRFQTNAQSNGFWHYNKTLFLRYCLAALFAGVLYIGLSIAFVAIEYLFKTKMPWNFYFDMWLIFAGLVHPLIFLSGIPPDFYDFETCRALPRGFRIFSLYILLPLVILYLLILYGYAARIGLQAEWPKGGVAALISGFGVFSIFTLLFLSPYEKQSELAWLARLRRILVLLILPLIFLLFGAVYQRVSTYGLTESRYYLIVLGTWLFAVCVYFSRRALPQIKYVPVSLCVIALLSAFGPWSAPSLSFAQQKKRLEAVLTRHGLLIQNKFQKAKDKLDFDDLKTISASLDYIKDTHGLEKLYWSQEELKGFATKYSDRIDVAKLMNDYGLQYVSRWDKVDNGKKNYDFSFAKYDALEVAPQLYVVNLHSYSYQENAPIVLGDSGYSLQYGMTQVGDSKGIENLYLFHGADLVVTISLKQIVLQIIKKQPLEDSSNSLRSYRTINVPVEQQHHVFSWMHGSFDITFQSIDAEVDSSIAEGVLIRNLRADVVIKL